MDMECNFAIAKFHFLRGREATEILWIKIMLFRS